MLLNDLFGEISVDFPIEKTDLGGEALKSATLFIKYIKLYSDEKLRLAKLENERRTLENVKREYYSGNAHPDVYKEKPFSIRIKTEAVMEKYINNDVDVIKYDEQIIVQKQKVEVLINCLDEVKRRGYSIRNAIDVMKFENGA